MKLKRLFPVGYFLLMFTVGIHLSGTIDVAFSLETPHVVTRDGEELLVGKISREELVADNLLFSLNAEEYAPAAKVLEKIRKVGGKIDFILFLATWSEDCLEEVPKLLCVMDMAQNPGFSLTIYALDRSLREEEGVAAQYGIRKVPTLVLVKNGKEMGRIVGPPRQSVELDLLAILESSR